MASNKIILIFSVVVLIAAGGYLIYSFTRPLSPQALGKELQAAINSGNVKNCQKLPKAKDYQTACQDAIYQTQAAAGDLTKCDLLSSPAEKDNCRLNVIAAKIKNASSPSVCDAYSSDDKANCLALFYAKQAFSSNDPTKCDAISDFKSRTDCETNVLSETIQLKFDFGASPLLTADSLLCNSYKDDRAKNDCLYFVNRTCAKIASQGIADLCLQRK